jgi:hypothetical protein
MNSEMSENDRPNHIRVNVIWMKLSTGRADEPVSSAYPTKPLFRRQSTSQGNSSCLTELNVLHKTMIYAEPVTSILQTKVQRVSKLFICVPKHCLTVTSTNLHSITRPHRSGSRHTENRRTMHGETTWSQDRANNTQKQWKDKCHRIEGYTARLSYGKT